MAKSAKTPPIYVIYGDEPYQKAVALQQTLDALLPPTVDRSLALCAYDGTRSEDDGGPSYATVKDDLATLPFLAERRIVLIREADRFVSAHRAKLEEYLEKPFASGTLVLECGSFPKTTRLFKAATSAGGQLIECKKLSGRALTDFAIAQAREAGKRLDAAAAARLTDLVGAEQGILANEIQKLCLYVADRPTITQADVAELVGQTREERIFAVMDEAAAGRLAEALRLWQQTVASDPAAIYKALGGMAFVLRKWLTAHELLATGQSVFSIAPKVMMYNRADELQALLKRLSAGRVKTLLAALADLDWQAKVGARSIEAGVESLLVRIAAPAT